MCNELRTESPAQARYRQQRRRRALGIRLARYGILVGFLLLWEVLARVGAIDPFLLSSPSRMVATIAELIRTGEMWLHLGTTLWETVVGFVLGSLLGIALAIALWWSDTLTKILDPYLVVLNALPKIALGPVLIVWIGAGMPAIITMSLLVSVIVMLVTVLGGFLSVEKEKRTLLRPKSGERPMAERTWLGSRLPLVQAEPPEQAIPARSSRMSRLSPSTPGKEKWALPGRRRVGWPFSRASGTADNIPWISRSRRAET